MAFNDNGAVLAVACGEPGVAGEVRLLDWQSGNVTAVLARCGDSNLDVAFRPGSDQLAAAAADGTIRIVDWKTLTEVRSIASHADAVTAIAWSEDGKRLVSASRDKSSKVFDAETGDLLASYAGHGAAVRGVAMTADGLQVISVGGDNKLHRWEVEGAKRIAEVGLGGEAHRLIQHQGQIWIPCADHRVRRFDLSNNAIALTLEGHQDWVLSVAWNGTTGWVASADYTGQVKVWNATDGTAKQSWIAKP
jgi:WD40 repeat protein